MDSGGLRGWSTFRARARLLPGAAVSLLPALLGSCGDQGGGGGGLPLEIVSIAPGFAVEKVLGQLEKPVKLALAADGRLFYNELDSGNIRVVDPAGNLIAAPFATVDVPINQECGLLGLALSPEFDANGYLYVMACVAGPDRQQVIRFTAVGNTGTDRLVLIDNLPIGLRHNSGDLQFLLDGTLLVSVGDTGAAPLAQMDGELAGRIHRYNEDGMVPADNPIPGSPEWARGIRNTFDMTLHPVTGAVFGSENGTNADDELNLLEVGKNYGWPALPEGTPESQVGTRVHAWTPVIAPTGIAFHDGTGFGSEYQDNLFVLGFLHAEVRRLRLSGPELTTVDGDELFLQFANPDMPENKPIDLLQYPDGSLRIATFRALWRVYRP